MSELSRLQWRCRRGTKELDLLLERYLAQEYPAAAPGEQRAFQELLERQDPELITLLFHAREPAETDLAHVIRQIRQYR